MMPCPSLLQEKSKTRSRKLCRQGCTFRIAKAAEGLTFMDDYWVLLKSWAPFIVLMMAWLLIRRPIMRRIQDWARARKMNE
jgi:hypothetical protein